MGGFNRFKDPNLTLEQAKKLVEFAVKKGINFIDFGKEYDEEFIFQSIKKVKRKIHLIARSTSNTQAEIEKDINDTIKKVKVKPLVYEIMINSLEELNRKMKNGVLEGLKKAKEEDKIKLFGIFSHRVEVLKEALKFERFEVVSTIYNAVHRFAEKLFPLKKKYNFYFIAVAPFATGILVDPKYDKNVKVKGSEFMNVENALKFVLSCKEVDAVVVGMKKFEHIEEVVKVANKKWKLSEKERKEISKRMEKFLGEKFCRMCRYCEGCANISIADILKLFTIHKIYGYKNFAKWQYDMIASNLPSLNQLKECEKLCPYNLPIVEILTEMKKVMR